MRKTIGLLSALMLLAASVLAAPGDVMINTVELEAYGTLQPTLVEPAKEKTIDRPRVDRVKGVKFSRNSQRITATSDTSFGISYKVNSARQGAIIDVAHRLIFPPGGLHDPDGHLYERATERLTIETGKPVIFGYGFDSEWERIPGEWVFQVWYKDARILQKTFTVVESLPEDKLIHAMD